MRITITTTSPDMNAQVDPRFGRGQFLLTVDTETLAWEAQANPALGSSGGAGTQVAQIVARQGAEAVISGDFGPNAFQALQAAGIAMYLHGTYVSVRAVLDAFKHGQLQQVGAPTGTGRHGGAGAQRG